MRRVEGPKRIESLEGGQSYLVSMGDMLSGLLFLFIITLVLFSLRLKDTQRDLEAELARAKAEIARYERLQAELEEQLRQLAEEKVKLEELIRQLTGGRAVRELLLLDLRQALLRHGTRVEVDLEHGILRLPEDVLFPSGSAKLRPVGDRMLDRLAKALEEILPGYVWNENATSSEFARTTVEAIFIEGHTDNVPVAADSPFEDNWELSTARAIKTYKAMLSHCEELDHFHNEFRSPLFSVSGYADRRPVASNESDEGRRLNRRIDLRFIMSPPKLTPEAVTAVEEHLGSAVPIE